ncbi:MAG: DegT/DnrJ/EryC1/StrS family aminotransferase, partial [Magnetospirillum sp.]
EVEAEAARKAILSGWVTQGPAVASFESAFAARLGAPHACAVSNCTTALHLALKVVGTAAGDVVLTVSHSFIATANAVRYCNADPVFVDIDPQTLNLDPEALERSLTDDFVERDGGLWYRHTTRLALSQESPLRLFDLAKCGRLAAILVVHQVGMPADLARIAAIAHRHGVPLVEDAACAAGSTVSLDGGIKWRALGNPVGAVSCFSFHPRKIITTGEGGMLVCADPEMDQAFRLWRQHGMSVSDSARHAATDVVFEDYVTVGYNYRMSDIQAAVGLAQLGRLDGIVAQRRSIAATYGERLTEAKGIRPPTEPAYARSNWQSYVAMLDDPVLQRPVIRGLMNAGISARRGIMCAHLESPYAAAWPRGVLPFSERARDCGLILPLHHEITEDIAATTADILIDIVRRERG